MERDLASLSDEDLMWLLHRDNLDAFEVLADRYEKKLLNFLYRFLGNVATAEDLLQQTLLKVYRARRKFRHKGKFSTWLYTVAANVARDHLRKHRRVLTVSLDEPVSDTSNVIDFYQGAEPDEPTPMERREMEQVVRTAVDSLPEGQRLAILLSHYDSLSYGEIADILRCSKGTVKSRIFRAKARLKELLSNYFFTKERGEVDGLQEGHSDAAGISR